MQQTLEDAGPGGLEAESAGTGHVNRGRAGLYCTAGVRSHSGDAGEMLKRKYLGVCRIAGRQSCHRVRRGGAVGVSN